MMRLSECEINIKYNPNYAEAYSNLGIIYATRGDMKNAIFTGKSSRHKSKSQRSY